MTFVFPAKVADLSRAESPARIPATGRSRPQVVQRAANPGYHAVIKEFEGRDRARRRSLNTSFNLHGEPIVYSPADAMRVLQASGLRHLAFDHYLVSKKAA